MNWMPALSWASAHICRGLSKIQFISLQNKAVDLRVWGYGGVSLGRNRQGVGQINNLVPFISASTGWPNGNVRISSAVGKLGEFKTRSGKP